MKQSSPLAAWGLVVLSVAVVGAGVAAAFAEASPFFRPTGDDDVRWQSMVSGLSAGLSSTSRAVVLNDCLWASDSFYGRIANSAERTGVLAGCESFLRDHVAAFLTDSYGFAVQAYVAAALGKQGDADLAIQRSQATGPYEEWVSEIRVPLAERHLDWLSPATAAGHEADLAILVQTNRGIRTIAQRYITEPAFRERITDIVETLPPDVQKRFLGAVRSAVPREASS